MFHKAATLLLESFVSVDCFQITLTFELPLSLHGFNFDLKEVKELRGVWHPKHQGPKVGRQFQHIRRAYLTFLLCGTGHIYVTPKLCEL